MSRYFVRVAFALVGLASLFILAPVICEFRHLKSNTLYQVSLDELHRTALTPYVPLDISEPIRRAYDGDSEKLFLDALDIRARWFFLDDESCLCRLMVLEFPIGPYALRHFSDNTARIVFGTTGGRLSLIGATITYRTI